MSDEVRMLIWGYAAFVVLGGLMGLLMAKSRVSFITASIMAIPLALVALKVLPPFVAAAEMAFLGLFFGAKAVARKKLMPGLPMALVSFMALGGLMAMSPDWFPSKTTEPESGTAVTSDQGTNSMPKSREPVPTPTPPSVPATPDTVPVQPSGEHIPPSIPGTEVVGQKASVAEEITEQLEPVIGLASTNNIEEIEEPGLVVEEVDTEDGTELVTRVRSTIPVSQAEEPRLVDELEVDTADGTELVPRVPIANPIRESEEPRPVDEEEDLEPDPDSYDSPDSSLVDPS